MSKFFNFLAVTTIILSFFSCDMLDDPNDECGANFDINSTMYYKEGINEIDSAYFGVDGSQVEFLFPTPDWITEEGICSKEHITATWTITVHPNYIDVLDSIKIEGRIIVGMMEYPVQFERKNTTTFLGVGEDIGLAGWGPYDESGTAYIWGDVFIKFLTTGNESDDKNKLFMALEKIQLDIPCKHPKEQ